MSDYEDLPVPPDKSRLESDLPDDPELAGGVPPTPPEGVEPLASPAPASFDADEPDSAMLGMPELGDEER